MDQSERSELTRYFDKGFRLDTGNPDDISAFVSQGLLLISRGISEQHVWGIISHFVPTPVLV